MDAGQKRKAGSDQRDRGNRKKSKGKQKWTPGDAKGIQAGDVGIWVTVAMNKEAPSVTDLRQLFEKYAAQLYPETQTSETAGGDSDESDLDIESEIKKEIEGIKRPTVEPLFKNIKLPGQCLIFFKTRSPIEPVSFVHKICQDTADGVEHQRCRFVKRLTPLSAIAKVSGNGLKDIAAQVLAPHFHGPGQSGKKFAIRVNMRNNKLVKRDDLIQQVASAVGRGHKVDLYNYDLLILVEVYQSIIGMSVVPADYEKLKRYNIAELRDGNITKEEKPDSAVAKDKKNDSTIPEDEKNGSVIAKDEKLDSAVAKDEKPDITIAKDKNLESTTTQDEKPNSTTTKDEKNDSIITEEEKPDSTITEEEKTDITITQDEKPDLTTTQDENKESES